MYIQLFAGVLVLGLMAGCSSTRSTSYYLSKAERNTDCSSAVLYYGWAIESEIKAGKPDSQKAAKAVAGIKSVVPGCNKFDSVAVYLSGTLSRLAEARHPETEALANVYFDFVNKKPLVGLGVKNYEVSALYKVSRVQGRRLLELAIERGIWTAGEVGGFDYGGIPKDLSQDYRLALEKLLSNLDTIEAELKVHDSSGCRVSYNFSVSCYGANDYDKNLKSKEYYYRTYAQAARRVGDAKRASIAEQLVATLNQEFAARLARDAERDARYERRQAEMAQRAASSGASNALLGGLLQSAGQIAQATGSTQGYESGLLMQGVGAVMAGDNTAAQQALANAERYGQGGSSASAINYVSAPAGNHVDSRPATQCVNFIASGNVAAYTAVQNKCDFDISVNWCRSSGSAHSRCGIVLRLSGRSTEQILDPIKDEFVHAACRYPLHVYAPDGGKWTGSDRGFSCRPIP